MKKEKVFIVVTHKHIIKQSSRVGGRKPTADDWEVHETVEFVNQYKPKQVQTASAIADYVNRKMILGAHKGMSDYKIFENYIKVKYPKQLAELDSVYKELQVPEDVTELTAEVEDTSANPESEETQEAPLVVDDYGNVRPKTVFDSVQ